jgi:hypothetical protein
MRCARLTIFGDLLLILRSFSYNAGDVYQASRQIVARSWLQILCGRSNIFACSRSILTHFSWGAASSTASRRAQGVGFTSLSRVRQNPARHFLQGNRLRRQSGRSREDGQMFLGFEYLMCFFHGSRREMIGFRRSSYLRELRFRRESVQLNDQMADQDKDH